MAMVRMMVMIGMPRLLIKNQVLTFYGYEARIQMILCWNIFMISTMFHCVFQRGPKVGSMAAYEGVVFGEGQVTFYQVSSLPCCFSVSFY